MPQTINLHGPITESGTTGDLSYEVRDGGTIELAGREFAVSIHHTIGYGEEIHLTGKRGGVYLLRPFLGEDSGRRQIISLGSGAPLRYRGNEIRAIVLGNIIEPEYIR